MKALDIAKRAGRNLRQAKGRTLLTALAIAVGATTITLATAAGNGGRAYTDEMIKTSGDAYSLSVYPRYEQSDEAEEALPEYGVDSEDEASRTELTGSDINRLQSLEGVKAITPMLSFDTNYTTRGAGEKKLVTPVSVKADRTDIKLAAGTLNDNMLRPGQVLIPEGFLKSFGFNTADEAIGKTIQINVPDLTQSTDAETSASRDFSFTIAAVDKPADTILYYNEALRISPEDSRAIYDYQLGSQADDKYYGLVVLAEKTADMQVLQQAIVDKGYEAYSLEDTREQMMQLINIAQWGLIGFGGLAVIAAVFGIINTQYISVLERTQQIGLMKALGMRKKDIARLFRYEAAWVGLLGGVIGVVIAALITLLNPVIASSLNLESGTQLLRMDWFTSAILIVALMIVAILSGYFPARKAAKLDPIKALRTE